ncbi:MAG: hypothetical protein Q8Q07_01640 [Dehalococcoidales bacterium]|nr:hypothetical protein [Dehalococcoidales bacterium]
MNMAMEFVRKHPLLFTIIALVFVTIPGAIDAWWSLLEKLRGVNMPSLDLGLFYWMFPLLGLILFIIVIWQIRSRRNAIISDYDNETIRLGNLLRNMMNEDISKPDACLRVEFRRVQIGQIRNTAGPYLDFEFSVLSSSVYKLQFSKEPTGHMIYEGQPIKDEPEFATGSWMTQKPNLLRKQTGPIELRQFLLPQVASHIIDMSDQKTKRVNFNLHQINIPIDVINPNGDVVKAWRCPIPDASFYLPTNGQIAFP